MNTKAELKAVFLDRDGTINRDVNYCRRIEDFKILPGVPEAIRLLNQHNFKVIIITNQSGISRGYFSKADLLHIHKYMRKELAKYNANIDAIYFCSHHPDEQCDCRKPKPKLILQAAAKYKIRLDLSYMVGDDIKDVITGRNAGCKTILLQKTPADHKIVNNISPYYIAPDLITAVSWILNRG